MGISFIEILVAIHHLALALVGRSDPPSDSPPSSPPTLVVDPPALATPPAPAPIDPPAPVANLDSSIPHSLE